MEKENSFVMDKATQIKHETLKEFNEAYNKATASLGADLSFCTPEQLVAELTGRFQVLLSPTQLAPPPPEDAKVEQPTPTVNQVIDPSKTRRKRLTILDRTINAIERNTRHNRMLLAKLQLFNDHPEFVKLFQEIEQMDDMIYQED